MSSITVANPHNSVTYFAFYLPENWHHQRSFLLTCLLASLLKLHDLLRRKRRSQEVIEGNERKARKIKVWTWGIPLNWSPTTSGCVTLDKPGPFLTLMSSNIGRGQILWWETAFELLVLLTFVWTSISLIGKLSESNPGHITGGRMPSCCPSQVQRLQWFWPIPVGVIKEYLKFLHTD